MSGSRPRSLWPKEHGAYAQLLAPMASALTLGWPTGTSVLLAIGACAVFLANEPLLVMLGHRGARRRDQDGSRARRRLVLLLAVGAFSGGAGLVFASRSTFAVAMIVAVPAAITVVLAWRKLEHTLVGELVAAWALAGSSAPIAAASGADVHTALGVWIAWSVGFVCTVIAVHRVIARHRKRATRADFIAFVVVATASVVAIVAVLAHEWTALIAAPLAVVSTLLVARPPRATHLRAVGVVLASLSSVVAALATVLL